MPSKYLNSAAGKPVSPLPEADYHLTTPAADYDLNYIFPVKVLESNGVRLEPFIPSLHAKSAWEVFKTPEGAKMYRFMPFHGPSTFTAFLTELESRRLNPAWIFFAVIDKTRPEGQNFAGMVAYINSSAQNLLLEIGAVHCFPAFQRTHVNTHMNGLLLRYAFDELKLRRVQWRANTMNEPSVAAAKRLGFKMEGVLDWDVTLPQGKEGYPVVDGDGLGRPDAGPGRHSAQLSINWQMWRDGVRKQIDELMDRQVRLHNGANQ